MMKRIFLICPFLLLFFGLSSKDGFSQNTDPRIFNDSLSEVFQIGVNTIRSDFGPFMVGDSLYFTTYSDKVLGETDRHLRENAFYDLYKAQVDSMGNTVGNREPIPEFLTQFHDGPVAWCAKTGELFVTQSNNVAQTSTTFVMTHETVKLRIVIAKLVDGKWSDITAFPYNDPNYSVGHPAISATGDTLVFSSDRPGGFGETDLYYCIRKNGKWGMPVNFGPQINTSGKEEFPFITSRSFGSSFLIFASNGRFGLGRLDLYYTKFPDVNYTVGHFDAPINSSDDDFSMMIPHYADFGYLTSDRPGTGNDDIYKFTFQRIKRDCERELYVFDSECSKPIPGVRIKFCDGHMLMTNKMGTIDPDPSLNSDCLLSASTFGYQNKTKQLLATKSDCSTIVRDTIWMDPLDGKKMQLNNIYYDLDKWDILPEAALELDKVVSYLNSHPESRVEIESHTDSRANDHYNLLLSQRRAASAVDYLVNKGIDQSRIRGRGYGEMQLLNRCSNGVMCSPSEHRQNRRTEIYITNYGWASDVKQTLGDFSTGVFGIGK